MWAQGWYCSWVGQSRLRPESRLCCSGFVTLGKLCSVPVSSSASQPYRIPQGYETTLGPGACSSVGFSDSHMGQKCLCASVHMLTHMCQLVPTQAHVYPHVRSHNHTLYRCAYTVLCTLTFSHSYTPCKSFTHMPVMLVIALTRAHT